MPECLKFYLRKKARTKPLPPESGAALLRHLDQLPFWTPPLVVASYRPLKGEWDPSLWTTRQAAGYTFVYPRISPGDFPTPKGGTGLKKGMTFAAARLSHSEDWEKAPTGGLQPSLHLSSHPLQKVDVFLVPGLAFDRQGGRLGRGRGFYDQALSGLKSWKVGLVAHSQISEKPLPLQSHDVPMDVVVTDKEIIIPPPSSRTRDLHLPRFKLFSPSGRKKNPESLNTLNLKTNRVFSETPLQEGGLGVF